MSAFTDRLPPAISSPARTSECIDIRPAEEGDGDALRRLAEEMLAFYGADHASQKAPRADDLEAFVNSLNSGEGILVALSRASGQMMGFAAYCQYPALPMGRHGLFLLDLFVGRQHRRQGVGRALMARLAHIAVEHGAAHLDWTADLWNDGSLGFYRAIIRTDQVDKIYHRLSGGSLRRLAGFDPAGSRQAGNDGRE